LPSGIMQGDQGHTDRQQLKESTGLSNKRRSDFDGMARDKKQHTIANQNNHISHDHQDREPARNIP